MTFKPTRGVKMTTTHNLAPYLIGTVEVLTAHRDSLSDVVDLAIQEGHIRQARAVGTLVKAMSERIAAMQMQEYRALLASRTVATIDYDGDYADCCHDDHLNHGKYED